MKYLFVFLILGLTSISYTQNNRVKGPKCFDVEGYHTQSNEWGEMPDNFTGPLFTCNKNGQVIWLSEYKNGKLHGFTRQWDGNGKLWAEDSYKNGLPDGYQRQWYDNDKFSHEFYYENGKMISGNCFDKKGNIMECEEF
tara:strand:- start:108 stop:524 length:417 start_codon:yes stop_codon:yes gene_type:complete